MILGFEVPNFLLGNWMTSIIILFLSFLCNIVLIWIGYKLFPYFKSHEKKKWKYRIEDTRSIPADSTKLPNIGGIATSISVTVVLLSMHYTGSYSTDFRWFLIPVWAFTIIGFIDDFVKYKFARGLSVRYRLVLIAICSIATSAVFYYGLGYHVPHRPFAYISFLTNPIIWFIVFFIFSTSFTTVTVISVGFSDGIDGLLGSLWLIASIAYIFICLITYQYDELAIASTLAGSAAAFLLFNFPSSWSARSNLKRKAIVYAGETGSFFVGISFTMLAILTLTEFHWLIIGGVFVLEGVSALYQAKFATPLFRRYLVLPRFNKSTFIPHTDFPLPFMSSPFHTHFDMLGISRLNTVLIFSILGIVFGFLGVLMLLITEFVFKVFLFIFGIIIMCFVWQMSGWMKTVFIAPIGETNICDANDVSQLAIFQGKPIQIWKVKFYWVREKLNLSIDDIMLMGNFSDFLLWHPYHLHDIDALVAQLYVAAENKEDALIKFDKMSTRALKNRPKSWKIFNEIDL